MEREIQPIREGIRAEEGNTEKFDQKLEECQVHIKFKLCFNFWFCFFGLIEIILKTMLLL